MRKSVVALSLLFGAIHSFACCAQTVEGKAGTSPATSMVIPQVPTTADEVLFMLAADEVTYGNDCEQMFAFGGSSFSLLIDETSRSIQIDVTGDHLGICPAVFLPVNGIRGSVGPLAAGEWEIQSLFGQGETLSFTVIPAAVPEPSTTALSLLAASWASGQRRRRKI